MRPKLFPAYLSLLFLVSVPALAGIEASDLASAQEMSELCETREITLKSRILDEERTLWVRLPHGYEAGSERYPVLIMLDAEWHFHIALADVELLSECSYIGSHLTPRMIVVGVVNVDRNRDFTPTHCPEHRGMKFPTSGEAHLFRRFLVEEALPAIDETYRTHPFRILAGWSLGGLFTIDTLLSDTPVFDAYLAISPSLWWDDGLILKSLVAGEIGGASAESRQLIVTLGSAEVDAGSMVANSTMEFVDYLTEQPLANLTVELVPVEGLGHNYSPKMAYFLGLANVFADLNLPADVLERGMAAIDAHYAALSARYHFHVSVPEDVYGKLGWRLFEAERHEESGEVFKAWAERQPQSAVAQASLGSFYRETGDAEKAAALFHRAIAIEERNPHPRQGFILDLKRDIDEVQGRE